MEETGALHIWVIGVLIGLLQSLREAQGDGIRNTVDFTVQSESGHDGTPFHLTTDNMNSISVRVPRAGDGPQPKTIKEKNSNWILQ